MSPGSSTTPSLRKRALALARDAHRGQRRALDDRPYIEHPMQVAALLARTAASEEMLAAALLHDVVERSEVTVDDIESQLGAEVSRMVAALTEDDRIQDYEDRKAAHRAQVVAAGRETAAIFIADKLAKATELHRLMRRGGDLDAAVRAKFSHYEQTAETVGRHFPRLPLLGELRRELGLARAELDGARPEEPTEAAARLPASGR